LDEIVAFVGQCRGKRVVILEQALPIKDTGYCFAFQDVDLIVVRQGLDRARYVVACLHECAHFFLRHVPRVSAGRATTTFAEFLSSGELRHAIYRSQTTMYAAQQEEDAETLATLLFGCVEPGMRQQQMPRLAQELYGEE
jgi:hypothetical protein